MGKLDEQLIQLINNEIEGKGGGFEEFCTLASEVVQPVVKKVFPKNETLYKKAVKQILVRMYQKIEMADMNQIREWMERFALDVLEKNYPRETAAAKKRETRWRPLQNCRMTSRRNRWNCRKKYSLFLNRNSPKNRICRTRRNYR